jgi:hypothetical protein
VVLRLSPGTLFSRPIRVFVVGDKVFLKLQPYVQASVVRRASHKLAFKFFGPYAVLARVGEVSYKLQLPEASKIHPVFHVSQLKPCLGHGQQVLPHLSLPDAVVQNPVQVLQRRVRQQGHITVVQVLVQWSGASEEMATWEDLDSLQERFPRAPAWGQASIQGVGVVSDQPTPDACTSSVADQGEGRGLGPKPRPARTKKAPARYIEPAWTS